MLLRKLVVTNSRGSVLELPLADISSGVGVKDIQGLGPVKATLVSSSFANMDGAQYHSSKREPRNLVIKLGLAPDLGVKSVQQLRSELYQYFMTKTRVDLNFHAFDKHALSVLDQNLDVNIVGRIESCEPAIFAKDPEIDISIMCFDPDFVDLTPVEYAGMSVNNQLETVVPYKGSVETGVIFRFLPDRVENAFSIYHRPGDGSLRTIDFSYPMQAGDVLEISSVPGSKYAKLTRAGVETSVLWALSPQSGWLELMPGDNNLRVYNTGANIPFELVYTTKYGGL